MKRYFFHLLGGLALGAALSPAIAVAGTVAKNAIEVYRDPSCKCCGGWMAYLREHGYKVAVHEDQSMATVKTRLGVPAADASCHTALIGGYVIEGHVPVEDIQRLLAEHPDARGLAAPGMPMGSPGMPGMAMGSPQSYAVVLIGKDGSSRVFATHVPKA